MISLQTSRQLKPIQIRHERIDQLLQWTYQKQRADIVLDGNGGLHPIERLASGKMVIERDCTGRFEAGSAGKRFSTRGFASRDIHPDAELIHETLKQFSELDRAAIFNFAKTGVIPGMPEALEHPRYEPRYRPSGKLYYGYNRWSKYDRPLVCYVNDLVKPVLFARKSYTEWWEATERLRIILSHGPSKLDGIIIEPLAMPKEPWLQNAPSKGGDKK